MMTGILPALYSVFKKISTILFPYLLVNLFKLGYISSVQSYNILTGSSVKYKNNGLNFLKNNMYMHEIPLIKLQNLRKRKIRITTIACLTVFMRSFFHTHVKILLKGPANYTLG